MQKLLHALIDPVRREPGCLYYHLFAHAADPNAFVRVAGWANEDAVAAQPDVPGGPALLASPWERLPTRRGSKNPA